MHSNRGKSVFSWGLDSAVVKALACHSCHPGSNPGVGTWQDSGCASMVCGFPWVLRFAPPHMITEHQHPRLLEPVYKFVELSVKSKLNK